MSRRTQQEIENRQESLAAQVENAKLSCAKTALANPFVYHEGVNLSNARAALVKAQHELNVAQAAWDRLIAPAKGWAPDPFKEKK